jgi:hypothetical protein
MRNAERVLPDSPDDRRKQFCLTAGTIPLPVGSVDLMLP